MHVSLRIHSAALSTTVGIIGKIAAFVNPTLARMVRDTIGTDKPVCLCGQTIHALTEQFTMRQLTVAYLNTDLALMVIGGIRPP
jgi:hypothetical protein